MVLAPIKIKYHFESLTMMKYECSIVFFWVGADIYVPHHLVISARMIMGNSVEVIQVTDNKTPAVPGVNSVQRRELSTFMMLARLEAYSQVQTSSNKIFFCDADSLFINPLKLDFAKSNILLAKRTVNFRLRAKFNLNYFDKIYSEEYPEFKGQDALNVMPFLFGAIAIKEDQSAFLNSLLAICRELPQRFHIWFGDQYALKMAVDTKQFNYGYLDTKKHLSIVKNLLSTETLEHMRADDIQMITFKGGVAKQHIHEVALNLENLIK